MIQLIKLDDAVQPYEQYILTGELVDGINVYSKPASKKCYV